jgi:ADP-ribose pyrophosphatase YjhB (NUDIX family)
MEPGETPEETLVREMREEANLIVRVERLLFDVAAEPRFAHEREHTYLCTPLAGEAAPGYEPEPEFASAYSFIEVRWVPLADDAAWASVILDNPITRCNLQLLQEALGYRIESTTKRSIRATCAVSQRREQSIVRKRITPAWEWHCELSSSRQRQRNCATTSMGHSLFEQRSPCRIELVTCQLEPARQQCGGLAVTTTCSTLSRGSSGRVFAHSTNDARELDRKLGS